MRLGTEAVGQKLGKRNCFIGNIIYKVDDKVIGAELPHYLTANTAGREGTGDDAILTAAHGDGDEIHFCRASLGVLGERYFDEYEKIINK